ncbi:hypothetical protein PPL_05577 [Heterostelium album PN500]|uniref:Uncharacterized protein n=1 Tax=Heterostelium pallidum (strain ATCC 26659 / Pp 5 / PN500) TaxID=670386 RepID=D3BAJ9_HETP5|nr:hypothetical protein PPL_05577 [Heterostelium album PN500]EFA81586.1 hypothetical protein PPL_05577 [Heterostelium album PN500]|eukprot:XP_020433703.1 hypothetical protein PPL_05577 [Heterostelium album PN500]
MECKGEYFCRDFKGDSTDYHKKADYHQPIIDQKLYINSSYNSNNNSSSSNSADNNQLQYSWGPLGGFYFILTGMICSFITLMVSIVLYQVHKIENDEYLPLRRTNMDMNNFINGNGVAIKVSKDSLSMAEQMVGSIQEKEYDSWLGKRDRDDDDDDNNNQDGGGGDDDDVFYSQSSQNEQQGEEDDDNQEGDKDIRNERAPREEYKKNKFDAKSQTAFTTGKGHRIRISMEKLNNADRLINNIKEDDIDLDAFRDDLVLLEQPLTKNTKEEDEEQQQNNNNNNNKV